MAFLRLNFFNGLVPGHLFDSERKKILWCDVYKRFSCTIFDLKDGKYFFSDLYYFDEYGYNPIKELVLKRQIV